MARWSFWIAIMFGYIGAWGQSTPALYFHHLGYKDGLSDPNITSLYVDRLGFLWIGTFNGLNRFDGTSSVVYHNQERDSLNLKGNYVVNILGAKDGGLWVGTQMGLSKYNYTTGVFTHHSKFFNGAHYYAYPTFEDSRGLWLHAAGHFYLYNKTLLEITDKTNGQNHIFKDNQKPFKWIISNNSVDGGNLHFLEGTKVKRSVFLELGTKLNGVFVEGDSSAWLGTGKGLIYLNPYTLEQKLYPLSTAANCIERYKNWLFIGTEGDGLMLFDLEKKEFIGQYKYSLKSSQSISGNHISKLLIDDNANLYVGISGKGVDYANLEGGFFNQKYTKEEAGLFGGDNTITAILETSDGSVLAGTPNGGILVYEKKIDRIKGRVLKDKGILRLIPVMGNGILVEAAAKEFYFYTPRNSQIRKLGSKHFTINSFAEDQVKKRVLLATTRGLAAIDSTLSIKLFNDFNSSLEWFNVSYFGFIEENTALLQTFYTNLYLVKREKDSFAIVRELSRTPYDVAASIKVGNTLFLATSSGLYTFDCTTLTLSARPLLQAFCSDIKQDKDGNIWVNTNNGLFEIDVVTHKIRNYDETDGLQANILNRNTLTTLQSGWMLTGSSNGLSFFDPKRFVTGQDKISTFLTGVWINDVPYLDSNPILLEKLELNYKQNTLGFQLTPLDIQSGKNRRFTYQLLGYDQSPMTSLGRAEIRYSYLKPGVYQLKVVTEDLKERIVIEIIILPPFWETVWFSVLAFCFAVFLIVYLVNLFGKRIRNRQMEKMRIMIDSQEKERKRIAIDLHDDLGGRLSSLKHYLQATSKGISEEHKEVYKSTTKLLDEAISELRNILYNLSPKTLDENGLVPSLLYLIRNISRVTHIKIELAEDIGDLEINKQVQFAIYRICQELLNNTLKHAQATEVIISLVYRDSSMVLLYEDNGKGFDLGNNTKGYGLRNIFTHAQTINSEIILDTSPGMGLAATLTIPEKTLKPK